MQLNATAAPVSRECQQDDLSPVVAESKLISQSATPRDVDVQPHVAAASLRGPGQELTEFFILRGQVVGFRDSDAEVLVRQTPVADVTNLEENHLTGMTR